ncbi:MAG: hypothetical protein ACRCTS_06715 [Fusobacteriaceae bacterium]
MNVDEDIREYRIILWRYRKAIPNWVIYSLPDGLWIYSFGIAFLYRSRFFIWDSLFFGVITIFMVVFEFFQMRFGGHGSLVGTFDLTDIYCFIGGAFLALLSAFFSIINERIPLFQQFKNYNLKILSFRLFIIFIFTLLAIFPTLFKF